MITMVRVFESIHSSKVVLNQQMESAWIPRVGEMVSWCDGKFPNLKYYNGTVARVQWNFNCGPFCVEITLKNKRKYKHRNMVIT